MHNFENGMFISNNILTAMMQPCTLEYVLPVHFRFQVACPIVEKKKKTDQSNASNTVMSLSTAKVIDQLHASTYLKEFLQLTW